MRRYSVQPYQPELHLRFSRAARKLASGHAKSSKENTVAQRVNLKALRVCLGMSCCAILQIMLCTFPTQGQSGGTGALAGTISDKSGAVIPGVLIELTNIATNIQRTTTTASDGSYKFGLLAPGEYRLKFEAKGFKSTLVPSVTINVTETPIVNEVLEIGAAEQTVTIETADVGLQSENATLGTLVSGRQIRDVPLASRNYTQILSLSPGVVANVSNASTLGQGSQNLYVNGNFSEANNYQMDGVPINNYANGNAGVLNGYYGGIPIPNPDTLQEFKIQTTQYDAGYGRNPGANVNVVTRSGTDKLHGSLFEFIRNNALNANDYFAKLNGVPRGALKQNQFGGTIGGPIWAKRHFYFFFSYQGTRQVNAVSSDGYSTSFLPNLSDDRSRATLGSKYCGGTGQFGGVAIACDGSNINPIALAILQTKVANGQYYIPTPQTTRVSGGQTLGFSSFAVPGTYKEDQYLLNTDWALSSKHTLSERYLMAFNPLTSSFSQANQLPGSGRRVHSGSTDALLKLTSLFTNNIVNEAKLSYLYFRAGVDTTDPVTAASVGMNSSSFYPPLPPISVSGLFSIGGADTDGAKQPLTMAQYADDLSLIHRKHSVRIGFLGDEIFWHQQLYGLNRGALTFLTFNDFLLGLSGLPQSQGGNGSGISNVYATSSGITPPGGAINSLRARDLSAYIQDDYKLNSRLTVNVGLRYEYFGQLWDRRGVVADFWPFLGETVPTPPTGGTYVGWTVPPNYTGNPYNFPLPGGVTVRSDLSGSKNGAPRDNFAPRAGFAYQPTDRFVVRAGYGWFNQRVSGDFLLFPVNFSLPNTSSSTLSGASNINASLLNPINPRPQPGWSAALRTPTSTVSLYALDPFVKTPLTQQWNLDLQYQFGHSWTADAAYVGTRGEHQNLMTRLYTPQLASPSSPLNCGLPTGCVTTNTVANAASRMPVVGFAPTGFNYLTTSGDSNYSGLQTSLRKQLSYGLQVQAAFTWSKALGNYGDSGGNYGGVQTSNDPTNKAQSYGRLDIDRNRRFIASYTWEIPRYSRGGEFVRTLTDGWRVSGLTTIQSGLPVNITDSRGGSIFGNIGTSRGQLCPGKTIGDVVNHSGGVSSKLRNYLNISAVCSPPADPQGTVVNGQVPTDFGNIQRDAVSGPGQNNTDISLAKRTPLPFRETTLDFRADFYNAFNHAQFANPAAGAATAATFGVISSTTVQPRLIQFGMDIHF